MQTFVVRVWVPGIEDPAGEPPLRGFVTAASSGLTFPFQEESELVALVKDATREAPPAPPAEGEAR